VLETMSEGRFNLSPEEMNTGVDEALSRDEALVESPRRASAERTMASRPQTYGL
jgi:hypothetical protein